MRGALLLALFFVALSVLESSGLWVFQPMWLSALPLLMITGFLVLQRVGIGEGIMWFLAIALLRMDIAPLLVLASAPILMVRLFSTRSVYALLGAGLTAYGIMIFTIFLAHSIAGFLRLSTTWHAPFSLLLTQWALLGPGLYIGLSIVRWLEQTIGSRVAFKPLT